MKIISALVLVLALAACSSTKSPQAVAPAPASGASGSSVTLTEADRTAVENAVRARAGQPSATFRTMIAQRDAGGAVMVCGYVNPGSGDTPFVGTLVEGGFIVSDLGGPAERTMAVQNTCHGRGIYL